MFSPKNRKTVVRSTRSLALIPIQPESDNEIPFIRLEVIDAKPIKKIDPQKIRFVSLETPRVVFLFFEFWLVPRFYSIVIDYSFPKPFSLLELIDFFETFCYRVCGRNLLWTSKFLYLKVGVNFPFPLQIWTYGNSCLMLLVNTFPTSVQWSKSMGVFWRFGHLSGKFLL